MSADNGYTNDEKHERRQDWFTADTETHIKTNWNGDDLIIDGGGGSGGGSTTNPTKPTDPNVITTNMGREISVSVVIEDKVTGNVDNNEPAECNVEVRFTAKGSGFDFTLFNFPLPDPYYGNHGMSNWQSILLSDIKIEQESMDKGLSTCVFYYHITYSGNHIGDIPFTFCVSGTRKGSSGLPDETFGKDIEVTLNMEGDASKVTFPENGNLRMSYDAFSFDYKIGKVYNDRTEVLLTCTFRGQTQTPDASPIEVEHRTRNHIREYLEQYLYLGSSLKGTLTYNVDDISTTTSTYPSCYIPCTITFIVPNTTKGEYRFMSGWSGADPSKLKPLTIYEEDKTPEPTPEEPTPVSPNCCVTFYLRDFESQTDKCLSNYTSFDCKAKPYKIEHHNVQKGSSIKALTEAYINEWDNDEENFGPFTLIGWATSFDSNEVAYKPDAVIEVGENDAINLYSLWSNKVVLVSFDANGGEGLMKDLYGYAYTSLMLPRCNYTREGYTFKGWRTKYSQKVQYPDCGMLSSVYTSLTLIAVWEEIKNKKKYTPKVNVDGEEYWVFDAELKHKIDEYGGWSDFEDAFDDAFNNAGEEDENNG
ncbi:MAG: InlB B-repeat-containing protein [Bacteroidales bacterium]|nr:InlB B-repeat-containing protein [Bacteroidales bacterium]